MLLLEADEPFLRSSLVVEELSLLPLLCGAWDRLCMGEGTELAMALLHCKVDCGHRRKPSDKCRVRKHCCTLPCPTSTEKKAAQGLSSDRLAVLGMRGEQ